MPGSCDTFDNEYETVPLPPEAVGRLNDTDLPKPYSRTTSFTENEGSESVAIAIFTVKVEMSPSESVAVTT